jgi:hypothetical protein
MLLFLHWVAVLVLRLTEELLYQWLQRGQNCHIFVLLAILAPLLNLQEIRELFRHC